jgi:hypothetical protein
MYRPVMDQAARDDIAAAVAAHHELGRDFDGAVAEGLIERIGAEIDKRVDARLAGTRSRRARKRAARAASPAQPAEPAKASPARPAPAHPDIRRGYWTGIFVGAALTGVPAVLARTEQLQWVVGVWAVLAVCYFLATWVHRRRDHT